MAVVIIEGFGKGQEIYFHPSFETFAVQGKPVAIRLADYNVVSEGRNVALGVKSAAIAGVLTGGVGLLAGGALGLKKKRLAVITWTNGEESLLEVRSAVLHKKLTVASFKAGRAS